MPSIPRDLLWGLGFLFLLLGAEAAALLVLNHGHFTYVLDDPYIHLALAENILHGHYGIDPSEFSAPSSSILWPFLLAPFSPAPFGPFAPLAINVVCAAATVCVLRALLARVPGLAATDRARGFLLALLVVACNLSGLVFVGLEHSLQVLLAVALVLGLVIEAEENRIPRWLPAVILLGPLVRYESAALSLAALVYLAFRRRAGLAAILFVSLAAVLAAFSFFLVRHGLEPLPASVLLRLGPSDAGPLGGIGANLKRTLTGDRGTWLVAGGLLFLACALFARDGRRRLLASVSILALLGHFAAGKYDSFSRYELYSVAFSACMLLYLFGGALTAAYGRLGGAGRRKARVFALIAVCAVSYRYVVLFLTVPLGANNIYEQQFQMHRFVTEYYRKPVAVNDLGWAAYDNPHYVLDLVGLASAEPQRFQKAYRGGGRTWMDEMARAKGVECALIYEHWFSGQIPASWTRIGTLHLRGPKVSVAGSRVLFLAVRDQAAPEITDRLREFRKTLPPGVTFRFEGED